MWRDTAEYSAWFYRLCSRRLLSWLVLLGAFSCHSVPCSGLGTQEGWRVSLHVQQSSELCPTSSLYPALTHAPTIPLTHLRLFHAFHCLKMKYGFLQATYEVLYIQRLLSLLCLPRVFSPPLLLPNDTGELSQTCWCTPAVSATGEAEAEGLPEPKSSRLS